MATRDLLSTPPGEGREPAVEPERTPFKTNGTTPTLVTEQVLLQKLVYATKTMNSYRSTLAESLRSAALNIPIMY
jgi:hypothetical protein